MSEPSPSAGTCFDSLRSSKTRFAVEHPLSPSRTDFNLSRQQFSPDIQTSQALVPTDTHPSLGDVANENNVSLSQEIISWYSALAGAGVAAENATPPELIANSGQGNYGQDV